MSHVTAVVTDTRHVLQIPLRCLPFSVVQPGAMYNVYLSNGLLHPISKAENEVMQHKGAYILIRTVK